ncbi:uncharacterized protein LOC130725653 [Lotus japonicus]|uniref:uncharacterized protein LOC130725653 n=1 Tax=Lotus japonicus TaxID=34305 RepID=UPI00258AA4C8|nr:uncharacterized protein LOC130725653 [Lotus japonicus]
MTSNQPPQPNGDRPPTPAPAAFSTYYPRTPSHSSSSATWLEGCYRCLFLLSSLLAFLALLVALVIILSVMPKKPHVNLQLVRVQYMTITADDSTASISLTLRLLLEAVNTNKVGVKYGESRFTVMYRRIPLGKASIPGFFQGAHSTKQVAATISVDRMSLLQADAADLIRNASVNDRVDFQVLGDVRAKIRILNFDSPPGGLQVSVDCAIVISPRKQSLTYKKCVN